MQDDTLTALGALQVDETKLRGHVDEVVRSSVEETLNALLDGGSRPDFPSAALRALGGAGRHPGRALRAPAGDQGRGGDAADAKAAALTV